MIQPPKSAPSTGTGKIATKLRELEKVSRFARPVGRGVSYGPLGSTVRTSKKAESVGSVGGAVWL